MSNEFCKALMIIIGGIVSIAVVLGTVSIVNTANHQTPTLRDLQEMCMNNSSLAATTMCENLFKEKEIQ